MEIFKLVIINMFIIAGVLSMIGFLGMSVYFCSNHKLYEIYSGVERWAMRVLLVALLLSFVLLLIKFNIREYNKIKNIVPLTNTVETVKKVIDIY